MTQYSRSDLQGIVQRTANVYARLANRYMGSNLQIPVKVEFTLCETMPKTAAVAIGTRMLNVNMILLEDNVSQMINEVIPHEVGHLVQDDKFQGTRDHGIEWREIMRRFGKYQPMTFHTFDTSRAVEYHRSLKKRKDTDNEEDE